MTSQSAIVSALLEKLHGHGYFRPDVGPLKERLTQAALAGLESEPAAQLYGKPLDLEVSIGSQEGNEEVVLGIRAEHPGGTINAELALSLLAEDALEELGGYLSRLVEGSAPAAPAEPPKGASCAGKGSPEHHEQGAASARLKVTPQWLKSVIPCTDYSYDEIDGRKYIREYYWSKELIERLFKIKSSKTTPEDLQYVARECCDGDLEWARDLIARLKSPNRAEAAVKQPSQPPHQPHQAHKPQPKGAKAVPSERARSRSRHRRGSRDGAKDPSRKPEAPGPKSPAG